MTKTKPSHHRGADKAVAAVKQTWPATPRGMQLAEAVKESALSEDNKTRLVREIIEYEDSHGTCTQTFTKKVRKQLQ